MKTVTNQAAAPKNNKGTVKKKTDYRTFLSLGETGNKLEVYANTDPRFKGRSDCAIHLLELGMKSDEKARQKALDAIKI